jgi:hypothetical protein
VRRAAGACAGAAVLVALFAPSGSGRSDTAASISPRHGHISGIVPRQLGPKPFDCPASCGGGNLLYHDGSVMRTNTTYAIFWLPPTYSFNSDNSGFEGLVDQYFTDVAHDSGLSSNVYAADQQYYDTVGGGTHPAAYDSTFGGSIVTNDALPANGCNDGTDSVCLTDAQLQAEIESVVEAQGWPENDTAMYFLFTPNGIGGCLNATNTECTTNNYCAYHNNFVGATGEIIYADQPWNAIPGCDTNERPNNSDADPTISVVSHEHNEAVTDPIDGGGWWDNSGFEIADKCGEVYGTLSGSVGRQYNQTIDGHHYLLQEEWSNAAGDCIAATAAAPTMTSFAPAVGDPGGTITITGTGFTDPASVSFNGHDSPSVTVSSATQITATVPDGATTGAISVTDAGGTGASSTDFTIRAITSFSPTAVAPGTNVAINGVGFSDATAVAFGGTDAQSFTVVSDATITAKVAAGTTTGPVSVTGPGGGATSSAVTYMPPTISGFSPASASTHATVTVTGTNFTGATAVTLDRTGVPFSVTSNTRLTFTVPPGATSGAIQVTAPGGSDTSSSSFTVLTSPTISGFSPASAGAHATVTVTGTNFTGATAVTLDGAAVPFSVTSDTRLSLTVPPGATSGAIEVTTPGGSDTSAPFTVLPPPTITSFSPSTGPVGTVVTISGTNLDGTLGVRIGSIITVPTAVTSTSVTFTIPPGAPSGRITILAASGTASSIATLTVTG